MSTVSDYFGWLVYDDRVMKANLSADVYASLRRTIDEGAKLDASVANAVAAAMKSLAEGISAINEALIKESNDRCQNRKQSHT